MNNLEKLAVLTAMQKAVKQAIDDIRPLCDTAIYDLKENYGVTRQDIDLGGSKVGTLCVEVKKPEPYIYNEKELDDFLLGYGFAHVVETIKTTSMRLAVNAIKASMPDDVLPDIIESKVVREENWLDNFTIDNGRYYFHGQEVPAIGTSGGMAKTVLRGCKPEEVLPIAQNLLGGNFAGLLGGGENE